MTPNPDPTVLFKGKFASFVRRENWEYVSRSNLSGIVAIVALTPENKMLLIEQYRVPVGKRVIELPAGLAGDHPSDSGEPLANAARRELFEETGYEAAEMTHLSEGASSAGLCDEIITLFRATGLKKTGAGEGDGTEKITVHEIAVKDVPQWLKQKAAEGATVDLKVFAGLHFLS